MLSVLTQLVQIPQFALEAVRMISVNSHDSRPIYEQITENFRRLIVSGVLEPDEKLPSVRELAQRLAINPNTIQRAYRELEADGYSYSVPGKGSFVSSVRYVNEARRAELLSALDETVRELLFLGVGRAEILKHIEEAGQNG